MRTCQQGIGGIQKLHPHALKSLSSWLDIQHMQNHWLVWSQHGAAGNHRADGIADLACDIRYTSSVHYMILMRKQLRMAIQSQWISATMTMMRHC
jgi:hypothetical protein